MNIIKKIMFNKRILGLMLIVTGMVYILVNKNFKINHPFIAFVYFYFSIPGYLFLLIKSRMNKSVKKNNPIVTQPESKNYEQNCTFDNLPVEYIDKIERKTSRTTVTTETIYINNINNEKGYERDE